MFILGQSFIVALCTLQSLGRNLAAFIFILLRLFVAAIAAYSGAWLWSLVGEGTIIKAGGHSTFTKMGPMGTAIQGT